MRFIRVWTVTAVSPFARLVEALRGGSTGFFRNYITYTMPTPKIATCATKSTS